MSHILALLAVSSVSASSEAGNVPSDNGQESQGMTTTLPLPSPGTYTAGQFLAMARGANVPWSCEASPTTHTTPKLGLDRLGMKHAVAGYCGFNDALPFGDQERNARVMASAEIARAKGRAIMAPRPSFTVAGLVAGMPDEKGKILRNLESRIRLAKDAIKAFELSTDHATYAKACREHIVDEERAEGLVSASLPPNTAPVRTADGRGLAAHLVKEHEDLLSKLQTELAEAFR